MSSLSSIIINVGLCLVDDEMPVSTASGVPSSGITGTYSFGGGGTGDIATMTFNGGILTAVTLVP